ncbi:MAG: Lrp/AsnC family transcriptional regulator [Acidimicrobiales bacterium]
MEELDAIDRQILNLLQADGRMQNIEVAEHVGLSPSACLRRVRRLEDTGVIDGFVMLVDPIKIGRPVDVFIEISLDSQSEHKLDAFEAAVADCPEVMSCHLMAGDYDYILHLAVADTADYERIHKQYLSRLPAVARIRSNFAIRTVYDTTVHELD